MLPNIHEVLNRLAEEAFRAGLADVAGDLLRQAARTPQNAADDAERLYAEAIRLLNANDPRAAEPLLRQALQRRPDVPAWHEALGVIFAKQARFAEAAATFRVAVRLAPTSPRGWHNLAMAHQDLQQWPAAEAALREGLKHDDGTTPTLHLALIHAWNELKKSAEAIELARAASLKFPTSAAVWTALGILLSKSKAPEESIAAFQRAVKLEPAVAEAHSNLAAALGKLKRWPESEIACREAIRLNPAHAMAWGNLGNCLRDQGRYAEAEPALRETLRLNPTDADAAGNLALTLATVGQHTEGLEWYDRSLLWKPVNAEVRFNRSLTRLALGDFENGWPDYETRWETEQLLGNKRTFPVPLWDGGTLSGRTILLHCEQGAGDTIQFVRFATVLAERGATVLVQTTPALAALLRTVPGITRVIDEPRAEVTFHCHSPLMSLPYRLGMRVETIPAPVPYLVAPADLVEKWRERLGSVAGFKVGIAWQGNPKHIGDRWRSVPLAQFAPLGEIPGVTLCSLQMGPGQEQLQDSPMRILDLGSEITGDFADTAALIANLDLVIAVDTSVVHLAGALGRPVWSAVAFNSDWRWLKGRDDTPWYPTMRLFRQRILGDWDELFARIASQLSSISKTSPSRNAPVVGS